MKKAIKLLILVLALPVLLSGCRANKRINQDYEYIEEIGNQIVRCFDEKDAEGLKAMFSVNSQENFDLNKEIEKAFEKYEGKSVSYTLTNISWAGGKDNGKWIDKHFNPEIKNICTDKGISYNIGFYLYEIYEYDTSRIGIGAISLQDSEGNEISRIGGWAD